MAVEASELYESKDVKSLCRDFLRRLFSRRNPNLRTIVLVNFVNLLYVFIITQCVSFVQNK